MNFVKCNNYCITYFAVLALCEYGTAIAAENMGTPAVNNEQRRIEILENYSWASDWIHQAAAAATEGDIDKAASILSSELIASPGTAICCKWSCMIRENGNMVIDEVDENNGGKRADIFIIDQQTNIDETIRMLSERIKQYLEHNNNFYKAQAVQLANETGCSIEECLKNLYCAEFIGY